VVQQQQQQQQQQRHKIDTEAAAPRFAALPALPAHTSIFWTHCPQRCTLRVITRLSSSAVSH